MSRLKTFHESKGKYNGLLPSYFPILIKKDKKNVPNSRLNNSFMQGDNIAEVDEPVNVFNTTWISEKTKKPVFRLSQSQHSNAPVLMFAKNFDTKTYPNKPPISFASISMKTWIIIIVVLLALIILAYLFIAKPFFKKKFTQTAR